MNQLTQSLGREASSRSAFLSNRLAFIGKTFGGSLGSHSVTADCWLRFHGAWFRETIQGT